jgi:peroxiredoxin
MAARTIDQNAQQRAALVAAFDPAAVAQSGHRLPDVRLIDRDGASFALSLLVAHGPAVLIFFRFGGCPACNIALPYYDETLAAPLTASGIPLIAVSAAKPVDPGMADRHGLSFPVAADPDYARAGDYLSAARSTGRKPGRELDQATLGTNSEITNPPF